VMSFWEDRQDRTVETVPLTFHKDHHQKGGK
jgi:hypothetical protein